VPLLATVENKNTIVEDYIETGAAGWNTVQTSNDIMK
jgi:hypothetical protein